MALHMRRQDAQHLNLTVATPRGLLGKNAQFANILKQQSMIILLHLESKWNKWNSPSFHYYCSPYDL